MNTAENEFVSTAMQSKLGRVDSLPLSAGPPRSLRSGSAPLKNTDFQPNSTNGSSLRSNDSVNTANSDDKKPAAKRHNTRIRRGTTKPMKEATFVLKDGKEDAADEALVNSCAVALASLDKRACARAQILDAGAILQELLLPMSLPWAMPTARMQKAVPRDIEDVPGIIVAGNGMIGSDTHGKFEQVRSSMRPKNTLAAARRSSDPGVVELTTYSQPSHGQAHLAYTPRRYDPREEDSGLPGELTLRMFQETQSRKRGLQGAEAANKKTRLVSFRLGSSSSRSSIFDDLAGESKPLFLPALLPRLIQDGARRKDMSAYESARLLGSYNCRSIPRANEMSRDPSANNPFYVGRSRLLWTEKKGASSRASHRSLLTGSGIESANALKRPLRVKVAVRLNGSILSSGAPAVQTNCDSLKAILSGADYPFSYSAMVVSDALDVICGEEQPAGGDHGQCSLNYGEFFLNVVRERKLASADENTSPNPMNLVQVIRQPISLLRKSVPGDAPGPPKQLVGRARLNITPAWLDCLPTEDGISAVACTKRGKIMWERLTIELSGEKYLHSSSVLTREVASNTKRCFVCWNDNLPLEGGSSVQCAGCKVTVHASCLTNLEAGAIWKCHTCKANSTQDGAVEESFCTICCQPGGAMEKDSKEGWTHDACRVWCSAENDPTLNDCPDVESCCDLCGQRSTSMAQCSAENCNVQFHPMCGIIGSMGAQVEHKNLQMMGGKQLDAFLCTQYTLSMLHTSFCDRRKSSAGASTTLPIAFCGYHNPKRQADYYGLYPGACYLDGAISIPQKRS